MLAARRRSQEVYSLGSAKQHCLISRAYLASQQVILTVAVMLSDRFMCERKAGLGELPGREPFLESGFDE
jgi:hypothetical protein